MLRQDTCTSVQQISNTCGYVSMYVQIVYSLRRVRREFSGFSDTL